MSKHGRTKLVSPRLEPEKNQALEAIEEPSVQKQYEESALSELDMEIECPRCNEIMVLFSSFDELVYSCENCSFVLKCG
jgi:ribosomal protein S27E